MRKIFICLLLTGVVAFGFGVNPSYALLILSGDATPGAGDRLYGPPADNDNYIFFSTVLQGGTDVLIDDSYSPFFLNWYNDFYNSLPTVHSTTLDAGTEVTSSLLTDVDLFISVLPNDYYTSDEIVALDSYLNDGGSIFFLGEYERSSAPENGYSNLYINAALSGLGSDMSILTGTDYFDVGDQFATGSQIAVDPLTAGVNKFAYGAFTEVDPGSDGKVLFYGHEGQPFMAYEGAVAVPEPSTLLLFGTGLLGIGIFRRKLKG